MPVLWIGCAKCILNRCSVCEEGLVLDEGEKSCSKIIKKKIEEKIFWEEVLEWMKLNMSFLTFLVFLLISGFSPSNRKSYFKLVQIF